MVQMKQTNFDLNSATPVVMDWHDKKALFEEVGLGLTIDENDPNSFDAQNTKNLAAASDNNQNARAYTAIGKREENKAASIRNQETVRQSSASSSQILEQSKSGLSHVFETSAEGFLQTNGIDSTIEDKIEMENDAQANIILYTVEEKAMQDYMTGKTNEVPEELKQMAEERNISNPTGADLEREDYEEIIKSELPQTMANRIIEGDIKEMTAEELLPPTPVVAPNLPALEL